jgi:hypothetical protein
VLNHQPQAKKSHPPGQGKVAFIENPPRIMKKAVVSSLAALVRFKEGEVRNHLDCALTRNLDPPVGPDSQVISRSLHVSVRTGFHRSPQDALNTGADGTVDNEGLVARHDR